MSRILPHLHAFWQNAKGVSAVEFAMVLPFLLILLIGMVEVTGTVDHSRKVSRIASSITDLIAQAQTVDKSDLKNILEIGPTILEPYSSDNLYSIVASVTFDSDAKASVDWSYDSDGGEPWPTGAEPPVSLPSTIAIADTSIVVTQTDLTYVPAFAGIFTNYFQRASSYDLSDTYYLRPRLTGTVACSNC